MQITVEAKGPQANQLSHYFAKHPDRPYIKETEYGRVELKYLHYEPEHVKVYITFVADALTMVKESTYMGLDHYINDRSFSLSSIFLGQIRQSIGYILGGEKEGITTPYEMTVSLSPLSTRIPKEKIIHLFQCLGYEVTIQSVNSSYTFAETTEHVLELTLSQHMDITSLFRQLYVLIPVLDNYKHHYVTSNDVDKLLRYGEGWLEQHPEKEFVIQRYLAYKKELVFEAVQRMTESSGLQTSSVDILPTNAPLNALRYDAFVQQLKAYPITEVVDMGAGEGKLIQRLAFDKQFTQLYACEPTRRGMERMHKMVKEWCKEQLDALEPTILQSSLFYRDERLRHKEAIVLCEVIEHLDWSRVPDVMDTILGYYEPQYLLLSTPNKDYNHMYDLGTALRHSDHRFELTREEFTAFIDDHARTHHYDYALVGIGEHHDTYGHPTQMAILTKQPKQEKEMHI